MSNDNLPPGVSVSDIPGNTLEDMAKEEFESDVFTKFKDLGLDIRAEDQEALMSFIWDIRNESFHAGYEQGLRAHEDDITEINEGKEEIAPE
ncbi:MAG: hypothetical protein C5B59_17435 [Bacteroidetes bacterium]|nr:MAG: hypothetical protein C5B59_17435 [Bacteroidota bacterium]